MKNKLKYLFAFTLFILVSCSNSKKKLLGDWEMYDMKTQTHYYKAVKMFASDYAIKQYLKKIGNIEFIKEYDSYPESEKEKIRNVLAKQLDLSGEKSWSKFHDGGFISLYKDNTFSFYFYPYYFTGTYSIIDTSDLEFSISNKSSIVAYKTPMEQSPHNFSLQFYSNDTTNFFVLKSEKIPALWELDTLFVHKAKNQSLSRNPKNNAWRFKSKSPKEKLKSHIEYLIKVFEDASNNKQGRIDINSEFNCSPLKFYGNGIALRSLKDERMNCWKGLFDVESEFHESNNLLKDNLNKIKPISNKNRFKMIIKFLNDLNNSL
ncbi:MULTISPECIES: hypothetical protein [Flavobacteriaceae]|uniref:hypothetical protein n=1 Tax=Flavobacteriaceae TaxID=49546 RepID=UPI00234A3397|nr:hypothetical protein [Muricauda sp. SP22]MDC6361581.1 hypothetical protein [Muricauda sp. SP22]